jgi:hypothetical protein
MNERANCMRAVVSGFACVASQIAFIWLLAIGTATTESSTRESRDGGVRTLETGGADGESASTTSGRFSNVENSDGKKQNKSKRDNERICAHVGSANEEGVTMRWVWGGWSPLT